MRALCSLLVEQDGNEPDVIAALLERWAAGHPEAELGQPLRKLAVASKANKRGEDKERRMRELEKPLGRGGSRRWR